MKTSRALALAVVALAVGFSAACWCVAQPASQPPDKKPVNYDFLALEQYTAFVLYLQDTKQTNTLQKFNDLMNASNASQKYADLGMTVAILQRLKNGQTNQAYDLLEVELTGDIITFVSSYRQLPKAVRDQPGLNLLQRAREYRAKYPFEHHHHPDLDKAVADAFKVLDDEQLKDRSGN